MPSTAFSLTQAQIEAAVLAFGGFTIPRIGWRSALKRKCAQLKCPMPSLAQLKANGFEVAKGRSLPPAPKQLGEFSGTTFACASCAEPFILPQGAVLETAPFCSPSCASSALAAASGTRLRGRKPPGDWMPPLAPRTMYFRVNGLNPEEGDNA